MVGAASRVRVGTPWVTKAVTKSRQLGRETNTWRVYWWAYTAEGRVRRQRSGFTTKGRAERFVENLLKADRQEQGWSLDEAGSPIAPQTTTDIELVSVYSALEDFADAFWHMWKSPNTLEKNRGRLLVLAAELLDDPEMAKAVRLGLKTQASNRKERPTPTSPGEWIARYLRDHAFTPGSAVRLSQEMVNAKERLEKHSIKVTHLNDGHVIQLRNSFSDLAYSTQRTYWATTKQFFRWLNDTQRVSRDPTIGVGPLSRDLEAETVDIQDVPGVADIVQLIEVAQTEFGLRDATLVSTLFYGALRISEAAAITWADLTYRDNGQVLINITGQIDRVTARYSNNTTIRHAAPKGRTVGAKSRREVLLPKQAANLLKELYASHKRAPRLTQHVFAQPRGGPLDSDTFRRDRWTPLVAATFPDNHRLSDITPHALRHGGMTFWLRAGLPTPLIQRMGGWTSLKVMLDTYAGVLPEDLTLASQAIEAHSQNVVPHT